MLLVYATSICYSVWRTQKTLRAELLDSSEAVSSKVLSGELSRARNGPKVAELEVLA